jgi:outer membrane protein OmpA-like peptidoglycan-associated protein
MDRTLRLARLVIAVAVTLSSAGGSRLSAQETADDDPTPLHNVEIKRYVIEGKTYELSGRTYTIEGFHREIKGLPKELTGLVQQMEGAGVKISQDQSGLYLELSSDVLFDFDKYNIRTEAADLLAKVAELITGMKVKRIELSGHTDSKGDDAYNNTLSLKRADSVKQWLLKNGGLRGCSMTTHGYGESRPIAPNQKKDGSDFPEGRQRNRRVEIRIPR